MQGTVPEGVIREAADAIRGPVDGGGASQDVLCRQRPPEVRVIAVVAVVAHHKHLMQPDSVSTNASNYGPRNAAQEKAPLLPSSPPSHAVTQGTGRRDEGGNRTITSNVCSEASYVRLLEGPSSSSWYILALRI